MSEYVWLNDITRQFLGRDYLLEGHTVEDRVDVICDTAEKILSKPGFAEAFKANMKKGWYSLSSPIWANFGLKRGLPISCVIGETWINTRYDGGKLAKNIEIGDEVLTHKGRYRKVTNIIKTENRSDIYRLKVSSRMTNLYLTGDHLVMTNMGWVRADELDPKKHYVATNRFLEQEEYNFHIDLRKYVNYEYVERDGRLYKAGASTVRKDRRVEVVSYYSSPFADVVVDHELAWAFGLWFAEGSLTVNDHKLPNGIRITTNDKDEKDIADRWLKIMTKKFGINGNSYESNVVRDGKVNSWYTTNLNSGIIGNLFASFGKGCKEKTIPQWIIELPRELLSSFLKGLLDGDGSMGNRNNCTITLANPKLILQVYQIGLLLNRDMSLQMQTKAGVLGSTSHVYTINFRNSVLGLNRHAGSTAIPFYDGLNYCPIKTIEKTDRVDTVYDFTVEEDHSFSAAGVVLHNCFSSYIADTSESIAYTWAEVFMMTKHGGGTSAYFGDLRPRGAAITDNGTSSGSVHFMQVFDSLINVVSQGKTRKGNFAAYLPIDHEDIMEFLTIQQDGSPIQDIMFGVCVPDKWMQKMIDGDASKRKIWARVLERRKDKGVPYIFFTDNVNNGAPDVYKDKGLKIHGSNLCSEILLSSNEHESFVCDLSSMNILHYDQWKDTNAIELLVYFLDAVMTEFIQKAKKIRFMDRAVRFAERQRAIGIGWIGYHSYLQSKMVSFESLQAQGLNIQIAKNIYENSLAASKKMAAEYGEPELLKGYGRRHTTLGALAPTKSSAFILGQVSESAELRRSNYFIDDKQKGKYSIKNPQLIELLQSKGLDNDEIWQSILRHGGSVQHLDQLTKHEKDVFKTFSEVSQKEVIVQAAQRQKYIDQGQSLNLLIDPNTPTKEINALIIEAWKLGIKTLYYQHSVNAAQAFSRDILACASCAS
jgi:ribonucleoside-diphosphate reductase alpha chain